MNTEEKEQIHKATGCSSWSEAISYFVRLVKYEDYVCKHYPDIHFETLDSLERKHNETKTKTVIN